MTEIHVEFPVKINGVILTDRMLNELVFLQDHWGDKDPNFGIRVHTKCVQDAITYLVGCIAQGEGKGGFEHEMDIITRLYYLVTFFSEFKVPVSELAEAG